MLTGTILAQATKIAIQSYLHSCCTRTTLGTALGDTNTSLPMRNSACLDYCFEYCFGSHMFAAAVRRPLPLQAFVLNNFPVSSL